MICLAHKCQPSTTTLKSKVERGVIIWDSMNMPGCCKSLRHTQEKIENKRLEKTANLAFLQILHFVVNAEEVHDKCLAKQSFIPCGSREQESSVENAKHWYWKVFNVITVYRKPMQLLLKFDDLLRSLSPMNTAGRTTKYKITGWGCCSC